MRTKPQCLPYTRGCRTPVGITATCHRELTLIDMTCFAMAKGVSVAERCKKQFPQQFGGQFGVDNNLRLIRACVGMDGSLAHAHNLAYCDSPQKYRRRDLR